MKINKEIKRHLGFINKVCCEWWDNKLSLATDAKITNHGIMPDNANKYKIHITTAQKMKVNGKMTKNLVFNVIGDWEILGIVKMLNKAYKIIGKQK